MPWNVVADVRAKRAIGNIFASRFSIAAPSSYQVHFSGFPCFADGCGSANTLTVPKINDSTEIFVLFEQGRCDRAGLGCVPICRLIGDDLHRGEFFQAVINPNQRKYASGRGHDTLNDGHLPGLAGRTAQLADGFALFKTHVVPVCADIGIAIVHRFQVEADHSNACIIRLFDEPAVGLHVKWMKNQDVRLLANQLIEGLRSGLNIPIRVTHDNFVAELRCLALHAGEPALRQIESHGNGNKPDCLSFH